MTIKAILAEMTQDAADEYLSPEQLETALRVDTGYAPSPPLSNNKEFWVGTELDRIREAYKARCIKALEKAPSWFRYKGPTSSIPLEYLENLTAKQRYGV